MIKTLLKGVNLIASLFDDPKIYKKASDDCDKIFTSGGIAAVINHAEVMNRNVHTFKDMSYVRGVLRAYNKLKEA